MDSPYEVHDYVKMYLGESRDTAEFARQFLERRNRQREQQRKQREMVRRGWLFVVVVVVAFGRRDQGCPVTDKRKTPSKCDYSLKIVHDIILPNDEGLF